MQIYWIEPVKEEGIFELVEEDAHHCTVVMRNKLGDVVWGTDGNGNAYELEIIGIQKKNVFLKALTHHPNLGEPPQKTYLAFAYLKQPARMEWLIEKAVELGVTHIFPFQAKRSEKKSVPFERLQKIAKSAVKQCKRSVLPTMICYPNLETLLKEQLHNDIQGFMGHCAAQTPLLSFQNCLSLHDNFFLIGPEGDFTEQEILIAEQNNIQFFSLGSTRFRAETAAILALSINRAFNFF